MNLPASLFDNELLWLCNLMFFILLIRAMKFAGWREMFANNMRTNALIGLLFCTPVFWILNAGIHPGFSFHLIGTTIFLLMFGWPIALISLTLIMFGTGLYADADIIALGMNGLLILAIPMLFIEWMLRFSQRYLPKNFFLFVLLNGFVCAAIASAIMMGVTTLSLLAFSHYTWPEIQYHYFIPAPILIFAEAFTTGAVMTGFTVSQPEAVKNFSIDDYLTGK